MRRRFAAAASILLLLAGWWATLAPGSIGGPATYAIVRGTSMEPLLHNYDFIIVKKQASYKIGDDILYKKYGGMVVHRVRAESTGGYRTQGINNPHRDSWVVADAEILGSIVVVLPGFGKYVTGLFSHPLMLGAMAAGFAAFSFFPLHRRKITHQLKGLLEASRKPERKPSSWLMYLFDLMIVLLAISITGVVVLSISQVAFWPRMAMALAGMVAALAATVSFGLAIVNGIGMSEPKRSLFVLGSVMREVDPNVEIVGPTVRARSAVQLRDFAEVARLPVLHWQDPVTKIHSFVLVAEDGNCLWEVVGE